MSASEPEADREETPSDSNELTAPSEILPTDRRAIELGSEHPESEEPTGILGWIRGLFTQETPEPERKRDQDFIVNQLPNQYEYISAVDVDGEPHLRSNITGDLHEPDEVHELFVDLGALNGLGASEIDPFKPSERPKGPLGR